MGEARDRIIGPGPAPFLFRAVARLTDLVGPWPSQWPTRGYSAIHAAESSHAWMSIRTSCKTTCSAALSVSAPGSLA